MASSMLSPKTSRNTMFPMRWAQPPWRNIDVIRPYRSWKREISAGIAPHWKKKASSLAGGRMSSKRKTTTQSPMIVQLTYGLMAVPAFSSPIGNTARLLAPRRAVEPDVDATVRRPFRGNPIAHLGFQVCDLLRGALADVVPALGEISACLRAGAWRLHETVNRPNSASQRRANHECDGMPFLRHCQTSTAPSPR